MKRLIAISMVCLMAAGCSTFGSTAPNFGAKVVCPGTSHTYIDVNCVVSAD